ncbi:MAG TPA: sigma-54 dependent transcriptional regulator, partial [Vicinamibacterales bacterium]|nr:sigma-54 dependent transcriptional regulator [Vicinamibacterales bacterium]
MTLTINAKGSLADHGLIGTSDIMQALQADIESASRSNAKVLITGETGVGKEVVASAIHRRSARRNGPFVTVNCAGVPDSLLESEFFGHVRGSFTGAVRDQPGLLRQAHRGTVLLDEVGEMTLRMQALLLRFLETGEIQTVGGTVTRSPVDARVITATNRDLLDAASAGEFRQDLYYRLNVFHVRIPPLRERRPDVALLIDHYGRLFAEQYGKPAPVLSRAALDLLMGYHWPGNIRELKNVVERMVLQMTGPTVELEQLPQDVVRSAQTSSAGAGTGDDHLAVSHHERVEALMRRLLVDKESFWTTVYAMFMSRDITRDDLRYFVRTGLEQTRGSYRMLVALFNMAADDYRRFLGFLKQHDCHIPFQGFRMTPATVREVHPSGAESAPPARRADGTGV